MFGLGAYLYQIKRSLAAKSMRKVFALRLPLCFLRIVDQSRIATRNQARA